MADPFEATERLRQYRLRERWDAARAFAPTWDMVMGYKRGEIGEAEYTRRYLALLDKVPVETWRWLYS